MFGQGQITSNAFLKIKYITLNLILFLYVTTFYIFTNIPYETNEWLKGNEATKIL